VLDSPAVPPEKAAKKVLFPLLTVVLVLAAVELGAFLLLSVGAGEVVGYGDLRALRDERRGEEPVAVTVGKDEEEKEWREHRIAAPPALHPFIGYVVDPVGHWTSRDPRFSPRAAEHGFPLNFDDPFRPPAEGEVTVGVFGGSFAANFAAGRPVVEHALEESGWLRGRRLRLLSFAVAGHKQPQQLMALNYFLTLGVHFDAVINLDGFNEIALPSTTNLPKGYSPYFPRGWLLMVGDLDQELRRLAGELTYLRRLRTGWAERFSGPPLGWSLAAGLVWQSRDARLGARITELERQLLAEERSPSGDFQARGPVPDYPSEAAVYEDLAAVWQRASRQIHALAVGNGATYLHFLQPNQYLPGSKPLSPEERRKAWNPKHPYRPAVEAGYPLLIAAGDELRRDGVPFTDLTGIFADVEKTVYKDACCHVDRGGNRIVAAAIAEVLVAAEARTGAERAGAEPGSEP